jgi:hypothetical protein
MHPHMDAALKFKVEINIMHIEKVCASNATGFIIFFCFVQRWVKG